MSFLRDILADLRVHPGRNLLTALSLFLGVFAVMAIIVTGDVVKETFVATAEQQGGRYQTFSRHIELAPTLSQTNALTLISQLPQAENAHIGGIVTPANQIQLAVSPTSDPVTMEGVDNSIDIAFVTGDYQSIYRLPTSNGRWLESTTSPYEAVLNKPAAAALGGVGTVIWLTSDTTQAAFPTQIVGVVNDSAPYGRLFTSATPWITNAPQFMQPNSLNLLWQQSDTTSDAVESATNDWLLDHRFSTNSEIIETDTVVEYQQFVGLVQLAFAAVAALSLLVAALGIVNVGLASVKERAHELVIRRAIGASKLSIVRMIVGSSLLLSIIVAAASTSIGWVALMIYRATLQYDSPMQPPAYPIAAAVISTIVAITTALLGSIMPGIVAARLQPGMALRS